MASAEGQQPRPAWMDHQETARSLDELLDELGSNLSDMSAEPSIIDSVLTRFWASFTTLKQRQQQNTLSVAVLALAKSGKSTLLNALVGQELLPMNNVPETARISKIVHSPEASEPYLVEYATSGSAGGTAGSGSNSSNKPAEQGTVTARGEAAVRQRLQQLNHAVRERSAPLPGLRSQPSHGLASPSVSGTQALTVPQRSSSSLGVAHSGALLAPSPTMQHDTLAGSHSGSADDGSGSDADPVMDAAAALQLPSPSSPPVATGLPLDRLLTIHAPVAALAEYDNNHNTNGGSTSAAAGGSGAAATVGCVRLQLLDTPGPNEAGEEELRHQVERLLDGVDAVLYILDYTKLKTSDEATMFERLRTINPALVSRLSQRLFFVVNKVDAAMTSEGQDLEQTREYVAELVTQQMGVEGFALRPDQVLLLSARNALLSRLVLSGKASPEARARFVQLAFGRFANPACITQDVLGAAAGALLMDSGVVDLEAQVLAYLYNHAAAVKQLALVDDLGRLLVEVGNVARSCTAALSASAEALAARVEEVRAQVQDTLAQFESVQRDADNIASEVSREVSAHLHLLRGRLFSAIINALDTSGSAELPAAATQAGPGFLGRGWHAVRERFLSIFTGRQGGGGPATNITNGVAYYSSDGLVSEAGNGSSDSLDRCDSAALLSAAGGVVARSRNRAELVSLLLTLHEELTAQIHAEVRDFWGVMEAVAAARHAELLTTLNNHLAALSRQVESAVSHSLEVRLRPVQLTLAPPDASQFHANIDALLARGVSETRERHIRVNQKQVTERVLRRGGICRWGDYWESVPRVRTVVEAYTLSVYELVPSEISQHFIAMVDSAIDTTQSSLGGYVSQFVGQQLEEARDQLQAYSHSYLGVMTKALEANTHGSEQRLSALAQVRTFTSKVNAIQAQFNTLQQQLARGVPHALELMSAYDELSDVVEVDHDDLEEEEGQMEGEEAGGTGEGQGAEEQEDAAAEDAEAVAADVGAVGKGDREIDAQQAAAASSGMAASPFALAAAAPVSLSGSTAEELPAAAGEQADSSDGHVEACSTAESSAADAEGQVAAPAAEQAAAGAEADAAAGGGASLEAVVEPRSPTSQSDSSSLVNLMLRAPLAGNASAQTPRTPAADAADTITTAAEPAAAAAPGTDAADAAPASASTSYGGADAAPVSGDASPSKPDTKHTSGGGSSSAISLPSGPFDYASGFINAMSSSQLEAEQQEAGAGQAHKDSHPLLHVGRAGSENGAGSSDEWDLVEKEEEEAGMLAA